MILHSFTHMTTETLRDVQMLLTFTLLHTWQGNAFRVICFGILQKFSGAAFPITLLAGNVGWVFQTTLQPLGTISSTSDLYCCFFLQTTFVFLGIFPVSHSSFAGCKAVTGDNTVTVHKSDVLSLLPPHTTVRGSQSLL